MAVFVSLNGCGNFAHLDAMSPDELCDALAQETQNDLKMAAELSPRVLEAVGPFTIADLHYIFNGGSLPPSEHGDAMVADFFARHPEFRVDVSPAKVEHSHEISMCFGDEVTTRAGRVSCPSEYLCKNYYRKW
jgi:hypothetical protein